MIPADDFDVTAQQLEAELRVAIIRAYQSVADDIDLDALADAIAADDEEAVSLVLGLDSGIHTGLFTELNNGLLYGLLGAVVIAMKAFATRHDARVNTGSEAARLQSEIRRNIIEPLAQRAWAAAIETYTALRKSGLDRYDIAEALRQSIALSPDQAKSAARFRLAFHEATTHPKRFITGDAVMIPAKVRDSIRSRHNGYLNAAQRSMLSKALSGEMTDKSVAQLVNRHAKALATYRHEVIARQESIRAMNAGEYLAFTQATANRSLPRTARRHWKTAGDEMVRHSHSVVPGMNAGGVGVREQFQTPLGPVLYPPLEVNCRCRVVIRIPDAED